MQEFFLTQSPEMKANAQRFNTQEVVGGTLIGENGGARKRAMV
jgi:hypothetical protein